MLIDEVKSQPACMHVARPATNTSAWNTTFLEQI